MRLALGLLMFMTAVNVGSFELPSPLIYGADLLNGFLMYLSMKKWRKLSSPYSIIFITWILLGVYIGFLAVNSEYVIGLSSLMESLRELYPFGLLIYITCLLEPEDFKIYINFLHLLCVVGCGLAIAQSLYGTQSMFESGGFYHEGHSGGQRYEINGFLTRIALPTIYLIQVMFLYNVYNMILNKTKLINIFYFVLYLVAILIGFSRSSWAGLAICITLALFITFIIRREKFQRAVSFILLGVLCISIVLSVIDTPVVNNIKQILVERVEELFYDIEKKDGNLGSRLSTIELGMKMYETSPWTGIDLNLVALYEMYQATDVGYLYALLTIGLIGLILLSLWYLVTVIISYNHILKAGKKKDTEGIILSMLLFTNIIFFIIIQQTNQFIFSTACLSITAGLFLVKFNSSRT
jgi:O-antigen ligase